MGHGRRGATPATSEVLGPVLRLCESTAVMALVWVAALISSAAVLTQQQQLAQARLIACFGANSVLAAPAGAALAAQATGGRPFLESAQQRDAGVAVGSALGGGPALAPAAGGAAAARPMASALAVIQTNTGEQEYRGAVAILKKMGDNILVHPNDPRFLAIRKQNARFLEALGHIRDHEAAMRALGFSDEGGSVAWSFPGTAEAAAKLQDAMSVLSGIAS
mmetsp:Transcript_109471/g.304593  ORF Transcript_109471/g.304593 Transcript_109471/m.304593 type:complete len:221 (-) Transcript_109471:67-729(-)